MQKKLTSKYEYIALLVKKIKLNHKGGKPYDWYFNELVHLYYPLIQQSYKKIMSNVGTKMNSLEIKTRILEVFFNTILKYEEKYSNSEAKDTKNFNYVWFSSYLKGRLPWELRRIMSPVKIEYDDSFIDPRHVELNLNSVEIQDKVICNKKSEIPISENFISLCRTTQKTLKNDFLADIMFLHFGYDYKNHELVDLLDCSPQKICLALRDVKKYWSDHRDSILP